MRHSAAGSRLCQILIFLVFVEIGLVLLFQPFFDRELLLPDAVIVLGALATVLALLWILRRFRRAAAGDPGNPVLSEEASAQEKGCGLDGSVLHEKDSEKEKIAAGRENRALLMASLVLLAAEMFISYNIAFSTGWDPQSVWYGAWFSAIGDDAVIQSMSEYFSIYPNNLFLCFIYYLILKLDVLLGTPVSNASLLLLVFQDVLLAAAGALTYKCARRFLGVRGSWCVWGLYVLLAGLSPWIAVAYSDGTGLIFPVLLLWLYLLAKEETDGKKRIIYIFLIGFACYLGFKIKPTAAIVLIAMVMIEAIRILKRICGKDDRKKLLQRTAAAAVSLLLGLSLSAACVNVCLDSMSFDIDEKQELGITHFLMIGVNIDSNGGFSQSDLDFSSGIATKAERASENLRVWNERLQDLGIDGTMELLARKIARTYGSGLFGWGGIISETYEDRGGLCSLLRAWYYDTDTVLYPWHALLSQWLWYTVLAALPFIIMKRQLSDREQVLCLTLLGLFLYNLIFEAGSRYLFVYVPFYCILAALAIKNAAYGKRGDGHVRAAKRADTI